MLPFNECFNTESDFFKKMMDIIHNNEQYAKVKQSERELHHIIPQCYYRYNNITINNTEENLVSLKPFDHFLVHYYAMKCSKDFIKDKMIMASSCMLNSLFSTVDDDDFIQFFAKMYDNVRKKFSESITGSKNPCYKRFVSEETRRKMSESHKGKCKGRIVSAETRRKLSIANKGKQCLKGRISNNARTVI